VQVLLPVWLARNGLSVADVRILQLNPSVIGTSLVEGQIDAAECWSGNSRPLFAKEAAAAGHRLEWLEYGKFNLDIYGSGVITTEQMINENPAVVRGFVAATLRGFAEAAANPEPALAVMRQRFNVLDEAVTREQIAQIIELVNASGSPGAMSEHKMTGTLAFVAAGYPDVTAKVRVADIYTNEFVN
jgi:NitT/TauT family transport system substrate-binding protein